MEVFSGRPADLSGRSVKEIRTYDLLDSAGIEYTRADHSAADTMDDCVLIGISLDTHVCKNLFLRNRQATKFYLLMMPADKPFKTKHISAQLGCARLSFAEPEYMETFLGISPGSVSVMGLMNDINCRVNLVVDRELLKEDTIGCHPCVNTSTLKITTGELFGKFLSALHRESRGYITVDLPREENA
ncbi:MAG: prolyl-tRNA synthetase associated domain-containing protein [Oscillospiraceae bacterium]|nr:prolyl-tRNA synthetase associated domain-containing protein [Oscillospiraceae bacterium]